MPSPYILNRTRDLIQQNPEVTVRRVLGRPDGW